MSGFGSTSKDDVGGGPLTRSVSVPAGLELDSKRLSEAAYPGAPGNQPRTACACGAVGGALTAGAGEGEREERPQRTSCQRETER